MHGARLVRRDTESARGKSTFKPILLATIAAVAAACVQPPAQAWAQGAPPATAGKPDRPAPAPASKPQEAGPAAPTPRPQETPFVVHTRQAGVTTCGGVYPALGQVLIDGGEYMVQSTWNKLEPNGYPLQALVGLNYRLGDYVGPAAGVVFAVPNGTRCDGIVVRAIPLQHNCQAAAAQLTQGSTMIANLQGIPVYKLPAMGSQTMLVPAGAGCIVFSILRGGR